MRLTLLAAAFTVAAWRSASADPITWEFAGNLSNSSQFLGLSELYPAGTSFTLGVTFDPASPRVGSCGSPQGLYQPFTGANLSLGGLSLTNSGGYATVNEHFDIGCLPGQETTPYVEFWLFGWSGPVLNPDYGGITGLSLIQLLFQDPTLTNGQLPINQPPGVGAWFYVGGNASQPLFFASGHAAPTESLPVVPEPTSLLLLASGLVGMGLRARKRRP